MNRDQIFLTADRVWDGVSAHPVERGFVGVADGLVTAVGRAAELPSDAPVRHLGDITLLPGLINAHVHLTFCASTTVLDDYLREREDGIDVLRRRAEENMAKALSVGVTTLRDLGTLNDVIFPVREAVRNGSLAGPDIVAAGEGITTIGGHCHFFGIEAEGIDAVRAAVRRQRDAGADVIKIFATGGNLTPGTDPFAPQYSLDELLAAREEADAAGLPVASHAHAPEGIRRSVEAGVQTVEHCMFETPDGIRFDERTAESMVSKGVVAVPTPGVAVLRALTDSSFVDSFPEDRRAVAARIVSITSDAFAMFARMLDLGVTVVSGSDAGIPYRYFDDYPSDLQVLSNGEPGFGMGPRSALVAATSGCARALGLPDRGSLEPGKRADILGVAGDPLRRIEDLASTAFVMCGGRATVGHQHLLEP